PEVSSFFSSRRRHTRFSRDWSSDVSSSDLDLKVVGGAQQGYHSLVVRNDAGIEKIADLKGKTLASQKEGSTADVVLKGVVLKERSEERRVGKEGRARGEGS